jgi:hypothetical protein
MLCALQTDLALRASAATAFFDRSFTAVRHLSEGRWLYCLTCPYERVYGLMQGGVFFWFGGCHNKFPSFR